MLKIVVDAGAITSGELNRLMQSGKLSGAGILLPTPVIDEMYALADSGDARAARGLEAIVQLHADAAASGTSIRVYGERGPRRTTDYTRVEIATMVRNIAVDNGATLYTADKTQATAAKAAGIDVRLCVSENHDQTPWFLKYFDDKSTMSVHLKEGMSPMAKRGTPASVSLVPADDRILSRQDMDDALSQVEEMIRSGHPADIEYPGALAVQYGKYRIVSTHPPFSEAQEMTIVHPTVAMSLADYDMPEALRTRLAESAEGILISGPPGSGKSTLASALANHYAKSSKTVKTLESPRDLQLDAGITQYSRLAGSFANSADMLLLVRPDYTVFDEVRRREDFEVFADLRLSGVGMVGVVHANSPLDAIQRFIGKIELGIIPHVLDTVVFVSGGRVESVYSVDMLVKVPSGMTEQDLARPVIEIRDFGTGSLVYEVYAFGEENMIVPVSGDAPSSGVDHLARERIREIMRRFDHDPQVEIITPGSVRIGVSKENIASIIGRGGSNISALERELRVHIDIVERNGAAQRNESHRVLAGNGRGVHFEMTESRAFIVLEVDRCHAGSGADIYSGPEIAASSRVDRKGRIRLPRHSRGAREIADAYSEGRISVVIRNS